MIVTSSLMFVLTVSSFVAGIHQTCGCVAVALSVCTLCLRLPAVYYLCGRTGPVRTADLWTVFLRHLPVVSVALIATYVTHRLVRAEPSLAQLLMCSCRIRDCGALSSSFPPTGALFGRVSRHCSSLEGASFKT